MNASPTASVPFRALRPRSTLARFASATHRVASRTMAIRLFLQILARLHALLLRSEISPQEWYFSKKDTFFENEANNILKTKGRV